MFTYNKERNEYVSERNKSCLLCAIVSLVMVIFSIFILADMLLDELKPDIEWYIVVLSALVAALWCSGFYFHNYHK